jgi:hypothetical protein
MQDPVSRAPVSRTLEIYRGFGYGGIEIDKAYSIGDWDMSNPETFEALRDLMAPGLYPIACMSREPWDVIASVKSLGKGVFLEPNSRFPTKTIHELDLDNLTPDEIEELIEFLES